MMGHYDCKSCDASPHEPHSADCERAGAVESDWTRQWDKCEPCEYCGNLVKEGRKFGRLSLAITEVYTFGLITSAQRDAARVKLKKLAEAA